VAPPVPLRNDASPECIDNIALTPQQVESVDKAALIQFIRAGEGCG
jgi:hypothetical protein